MSELRNQMVETLDYIRTKTNAKPKIGIVLEPVLAD